jgi:N-dimethylarginine dimethylaminohydrolase
MIFKNPKKEYHGKIEDYPLENYPDYEPGKAPKTEVLQEISYLDELERIWGKNWGSQGIGKLREVALIRPTEHEVNPLWERNREFFLLRRERLEFDKLRKAFDDYGELLDKEGVEVHWMEAPEKMGPYGPMRKLFMGSFCLVVRGGAIISRQGHGSFVRGLEPNFLKIFAKLNCPVLLTVHGKGICEVGVFVPIAEDAIMGFKSCACNEEGLSQVVPVLQRAGYKEIPIANCATIYEDYRAGGDFHIDMIFGPLDLRVALIYPGFLDYQIFKWLKDRNFKLIEVDPEEHLKYAPANLLILEPGKVIMAAGAKETIKKVRKAGIEVIEFDTSGLQVGVNGIRCVTLSLRRDVGPKLQN